MDIQKVIDRSKAALLISKAPKVAPRSGEGRIQAKQVEWLTRMWRKEENAAEGWRTPALAERVGGLFGLG